MKVVIARPRPNVDRWTLSCPNQHIEYTNDIEEALAFYDKWKGLGAHVIVVCPVIRSILKG